MGPNAANPGGYAQRRQRAVIDQDDFVDHLCLPPRREERKEANREWLGLPMANHNYANMHVRHDAPPDARHSLMADNRARARGPAKNPMQRSNSRNSSRPD